MLRVWSDDGWFLTTEREKFQKKTEHGITCGVEGRKDTRPWICKQFCRMKARGFFATVSAVLGQVAFTVKIPFRFLFSDLLKSWVLDSKSFLHLTERMPGKCLSQRSRLPRCVDSSVSVSPHHAPRRFQISSETSSGDCNRSSSRQSPPVIDANAS